MKLQELLTRNLIKLTPRATVIVKHDDQFSAQRVDYAPELLNLGVILLGYYNDPDKVNQLSELGDCLSIAHYLRTPRTLKYGRNFTDDTEFKALPAKLQKHLTGEIQDCTMAFGRDFGIKRPSIQVKDLANFMTTCSTPYVYLYQDRKWRLLRANGHNLAKPVDLRNEIRQLLSKKA